MNKNNKIENQNNENSIIITFHTKERLQSSVLIDSKSQKDYQNYLLTLSPVISTTNLNKNNEFVFLVDCSGSMDGQSIKKASECLEVFIRSLPLYSRFNIIRFGSSYEKLFESSIEYNEQTMGKALNLISTLEADLGGTQIMKPLEDIFSKKCQFGQRQVFIITDGEVWDVEELLQLISDYVGIIDPIEEHREEEEVEMAGGFDDLFGFDGGFDHCNSAKTPKYVDVIDSDDNNGNRYIPEEEEVEMAGGFDDLFSFDGGFDHCNSVKTPKYMNVIDSDDNNGKSYIPEEEEVEMAGGFDDLFDFGGGGSSFVKKTEKVEKKAENEPLYYSLMNLIKLQTFEGFWADLDRINGMLGVNIHKIDGLNVEDKDLEKKCISTILAIASFHIKSQNEKNTWSMIEHKAISWLKSNLPNVDIDKLIQQTENSIKI